MAVFFIISFIASVAGAISGIGGGILIKPALDFSGGLAAAQINFLSSCTVFSMASMTLFRRRSMLRANADSKLIFLALGSVFGGMWGSSLFRDVSHGWPPRDVRVLQSALLIAMCATIIVYMLNKSRVKTFHAKSRILCVLAGLVLGVISSFLGIGGGPFNMLVLSLLFSMDSRHATLSSIFIIFCSQIAGLLYTVCAGLPAVAGAWVVTMVLGGLSGGLLGGSIAKKASAKQTDIFFICVTSLVILASAINIARTVL